ncbi:MAG: hypothetical protein WC988_03100 [Patescibacteria group bacterium]
MIMKSDSTTRLKEIDRIIEATKENTKLMRETRLSLEKLEEQHGNLANNVADAVEDAVYYNLEARKRLGGLKFDTVIRHAKDLRGKEYDVVMQNGENVAVVEVKHKVHINDIDKLVGDTLPKFRKGYSADLKNVNVFGAIAGMSFPPDFKKKAEEAGLFVLTQNGKNIKVGNSRGFKPKAF